MRWTQPDRDFHPITADVNLRRAGHVTVWIEQEKLSKLVLDELDNVGVTHHIDRELVAHLADSDRYVKVEVTLIDVVEDLS